MKQVYILAIIAGILFVAGCAPQTKYAWSGYDQKLYNHYKSPADYEMFAGNLKGIITNAEDEDKIPPGLYAEYGFILYEKGKLEESQFYFKKEYEKWPESRFLMTKMISNTQQQPNKSAAVRETSDVITPVQEKEAVQ